MSGAYSSGRKNPDVFFSWVWKSSRFAVLNSSRMEDDVVQFLVNLPELKDLDLNMTEVADVGV